MDKQNVSEPESTDGPCSFASDRSTLDNSQKPQSNNGSSDVPNQDEENSHTGSTSHGDQALDDTPVKPFSVVPEAPSSSNLESLGDDDSDSNCTPSLGLDIEQVRYMIVLTSVTLDGNKKWHLCLFQGPSYLIL